MHLKNKKSCVLPFLHSLYLFISNSMPEFDIFYNNSYQKNTHSHSHRVHLIQFHRHRQRTVYIGVAFVWLYLILHCVFHSLSYSTHTSSSLYLSVFPSTGHRFSTLQNIVRWFWSLLSVCNMACMLLLLYCELSLSSLVSFYMMFHSVLEFSLSFSASSFFLSFSYFWSLCFYLFNGLITFRQRKQQVIA